MVFIRIIYASMIQQYKDYFCHKSIYVSLSLWPILAFITTVYSYKPFSRVAIRTKMGLGSEEEIYVFLLIGFIGMMCFKTLIQSAWRSANAYRYSGTLELLYMSPANRLAVLIGNALSSLVGSIWMVSTFALFMFTIYRESIIINWLNLGVGLLLLLIVSLCWGIFLNSLFLVSRDSGFLFTIFQYPVEIFSGAKIPFSMLPMWGQAIGTLLPLTYIIPILRKVLLKGASIMEMSHEITLSIGISIVLLIGAYTLLKWTERRSRIHGNATLF